MINRSPSYLRSFTSDFPSSIVVYLVALPLCLGIALGSETPLFSGIIAGIVGGVVIGALSGSQLSVSGPAAGLTAIVAGAMALLPSFEAFLVSVVLCGVFQIVLGFLKAGVIGDYIPKSVIKGMLAAIGLILIMKQLPYLIGYDKTLLTGGTSAISGFFQAITPVAVVIGVLCVIFQFFWEGFAGKRGGWLKLVPAPLLVVLLGVGINQLMVAQYPSWALSQAHMVTIPVATSAKEFLGFFTFPNWEMIFNKQVWMTAVTLALVASIETLLGIEAVDNLDPQKRISPTNRELKAQGVGNLLSGLIGGLPLTSVIVRSSANVNAGAKTKMSAIYHGLFLLLSVAFFPGLLAYIPFSALAAILIYTGYKLAKPSLFKEYYKKGWDQFVPLAATVVIILLTDLLVGVLAGLAIGLFFSARSNYQTAVFIVNDDNSFLIRLRKDVSILNKRGIKAKLDSVPENSSVLIDATRADFIDRDIIDMIEEFSKEAQAKNISVEIKKNNLKDLGFVPVNTKSLATTTVNGTNGHTSEKHQSQSTNNN